MQTERDAAIVEWIGRVGAAGAEHVMRRFGMGRSWTYARLRSLTADGLLELRSVLYRQPGLYVATNQGLRWQRLGRLPAFRVSPGGFEHARELATAAVALHNALPGWEQHSERDIRLLESDNRDLFASAKVGELANGAPALHRPDLALISPDGRRVVVEVELSVKAAGRLAAIARGYARARHLHHVYYLATPQAARAVHRAITETRSTERITVLPLDGTHALAAAELHQGVDRAL